MQYEELTRIATPEGVELELVLAGLASRFIAEIVDAALILLIVGAMIAVPPGSSSSPSRSAA